MDLTTYVHLMERAFGQRVAYPAMAYALMARRSTEYFRHARCMPLLWVYGPRGSGKTALLRALAPLCPQLPLSVPADADGTALFGANGQSDKLVVVDELPQVHTPSMSSAIGSIYHRGMHPGLKPEDAHGKPLSRWIGCAMAITSDGPPFWPTVRDRVLPLDLEPQDDAEAQSIERGLVNELASARLNAVPLPEPGATAVELSRWIVRMETSGGLDHHQDALHAAMLHCALPPVGMVWAAHLLDPIQQLRAERSAMRPCVQA